MCICRKGCAKFATILNVSTNFTKNKCEMVDTYLMHIMLSQKSCQWWSLASSKLSIHT